MGKETRRAFLEKKIVAPILIATGAIATACQRTPEPNRSELETAIVRGIEGTQTATHPDNSPTPSGFAQVMTEVAVTPIPLTPTQTGFGEVMTEVAKIPSPAPQIVPGETPTTTENLQKIQVTLAADVPTGTVISQESIYLASTMIMDRVTEIDQLDRSSVQTDSQNLIIVTINGVSNPDEAIETVSQRGLLEFLATGSTALQNGQFVATSEGAPQEITLDGNIYKTILQNSHFKDVTINYNSSNQPGLQFVLTDEGAQILAQYTNDHVGQYLGIAMDKRIISSPVIQSPVSNDFVIGVNFTEEELQKFVTQIKFGPLPFPIKVIESKSLSQFLTRPKTPTPLEKQEGKITLNPQDLYRALLTTPFRQDDLPQGFVVEKGHYPFSETETAILSSLSSYIDAPIPGKIAEPFKPIGEVMFILRDAQSSAAISYIIFSDSMNAEAAYQALALQPKMRPIDVSNLPALVYASFKPLGIVNTKVVSSMISVFTAVQFGNTLMYAGYIGEMDNDYNQEPQEKIKIKEPKTISLAKAGIKHLQKVGNPAG